MKKEDLIAKVNLLTEKYYKNFYYSLLGLTDYKSRINFRKQETSTARAHINSLEGLLDFKFEKNKKVLVVGGGTGAEFLEFFIRGCDVYSIEPNKEALKIIELKSEIYNIPKEKSLRGVAEKIPFNNNYFNYIYCWTVLEHVQNVEKAISEMVRVVKRKGFLIVMCPNYDLFQTWEPHYKLYLPLFMPTWFNKLILHINKRPSNYFDSLNLISKKQLKSILKKYKVLAYQIDNRLSNQLFETKKRNQLWIIKKQ